jgi:hypothetical protein
MSYGRLVMFFQKQFDLRCCILLLNALDEHLSILTSRNEDLILQEIDKSALKQTVLTQKQEFVYARGTANSLKEDSDVHALKAILSFIVVLLSNCYCKEWFASVEVRYSVHIKKKISLSGVSSIG